MVVVRTVDCALIADQLFAGFAEVNKGTFVMDTVTKCWKIYAGGIGV